MLHSTTGPDDGPHGKIEDSQNLLRTECEFGMAELAVLRQGFSRENARTLGQDVRTLSEAVDSNGNATESTLTKLGVAFHLLGQHAAAARYLAQTSKHPLGAYYLGMSYLALDKPGEAAEHFDRAAKTGYDEVDAELQRIGAIRLCGDACGGIEVAEAGLKAIAAKAVSRADYSFQMGCILADKGDTLGAIEYFERAVDMDPHHTRALFWLANESARHGNDDEAVILYERALSRPPLYLGTLLNLGVLYEDMERFQEAAFCYRRVLESDPLNPRARLYLKDIDASEGMFYDEDSAKAEQKRQQTLARPISDFELSVRSRNCLERLNMHTLSDLVQISEQELMSSRNFGETSLTEVRELLAQHGLTVGEQLETRKPDTFVPPSDMSPEQREALERPISDLNLSVRARKCMSRLNITTISELVTKTPDELLGSKNFGVTSLNEIRGKLAEAGLSLRKD